HPYCSSAGFIGRHRESLRPGSTASSGASQYRAAGLLFPARPNGGAIMSETRHSRVLILGSGPAGYTAAVYAARANLKPLLVQGLQPGGQLSITTDVENYPGFADPIQGPWLMEQMGAQAANVGTEIVTDTIVEVDLSKRPFVALGDSGTR